MRVQQPRLVVAEPPARRPPLREPAGALVAAPGGRADFGLRRHDSVFYRLPRPGRPATPREP